MRLVLSTAVLLASRIALLPAQEPADLGLYGRVWTGDPAHAWAEAVAVRGDRIVAVGDRRDVLRHVGQTTRIIDNGRGLVTPGFGDAHTHFVSGGFQLVNVDLRDASTPGEFVRRIAAYANSPVAQTAMNSTNFIAVQVSRVNNAISPVA